jgi:hypothetical protein
VLAAPGTCPGLRPDPDRSGPRRPCQFRCDSDRDLRERRGTTPPVALGGLGLEPAGIAVDVNGHYHLCVERYYEDFVAAARRLESDLHTNPKASLPRELAGSASLKR